MSRRKTPPRLLALPPAKDPEILDRAEKVLDLKLKGKKQREIAQELGLSLGTVNHDLKMIAAMKYEGLIERDELLILRKNKEIDDLLSHHMEDALGENKKDSLAATDRVIKLIELQLKVNGIAGDKRRPATPEELGTGVAMGVLSAFQNMHRTPKIIEATLIEAPEAPVNAPE